MAYEEEGERVLKVALLMEVEGAVESSVGKAKRPGIFVEVMREIQRFSEVGKD